MLGGGTATALGRLSTTVVPLESSTENLIALAVFFFVGLYIIYNGFNTWQRMRLIQDTPTEKVRSAAVGRTELTGTGKPIDGPLERPFTSGDCLVATYEIEEWEEDDDDNGGNWETVESGALVEPFHIDDGTGQMRVEPEEDATFEIEGNRNRIRIGSTEEEPPEIQAFLREHTNQSVGSDGLSGLVFGEQRRYTERYIEPGEELYLFGAAESRDDVQGTDSDLLVLRRDDGTDEFIIANQDEQELVSSYKWLAPAKMVGGLLLSAGMLYWFLAELGMA
jgi:hypothetical protein